MLNVLASDDGPEDGLDEHEEPLQHHERARRQPPGGQAVEGAAALVVVDLVVVAVDEQRSPRHVEEETEHAEQNVLGEG